MQQQTLDEVADIVSQMAFKVCIMYSAVFCDGGGGKIEVLDNVGGACNTKMSKSQWG